MIQNGGWEKTGIEHVINAEILSVHWENGNTGTKTRTQKQNETANYNTQTACALPVWLPVLVAAKQVNADVCSDDKSIRTSRESRDPCALV
jgi:hypothetical protein